MPNQAYLAAEKKIEHARRTRATGLDLRGMGLTELPPSLFTLTQLQALNLSHNYLTTLPDAIGQLIQLQELDISFNEIGLLPEWLSKLRNINELNLFGNKFTNLPIELGELVNLEGIYISSDEHKPWAEFPIAIRKMKKLRVIQFQGGIQSLPDWLSELSNLEFLDFSENNLINLPPSLVQFEHLKLLDLRKNPLNPELAEAYKQGLPAVKLYLRLKQGPQITLNEAKLILVGEGEVGKTCLMDALMGKAWEEHPSTHGISIQSFDATDEVSGSTLTLNGWDFGGQRVYRPTHQLFFSAPAVYLVVWKPREGTQQGLVKEWITLIKRREPSAKILVVATHGGPQQRQPDIDRQELWDAFGHDLVVDFFWVESKPDANGERRGIESLKRAIARVAAQLPEVGRSVPKRWQDVRDALTQSDKAYLPLADVLALCREHKMEDDEANLFVTIEHRLGHLIHYQHDPTLRDLVVLKPDWLATAISFVLDDAQTRNAHGLVRASRLGQLWNDPQRPERYPAALHPIFARLMERFDLAYRVADPTPRAAADPQYLIAQLVPDIKPDPITGWINYASPGDAEQTQICRIVDAQTAQSAAAEGLFFQLIVRLHKHSLGRADYNDSVHWQRGLVLDDDYNGRALLEHKGNDVHITVRAAYPERFLTMLTEEVKYLVESFWEGLRCNVMVPCIEPCRQNKPGTGLYDVRHLIESKREGQNKFPCPTCNQWQDITALLTNAPAAQPDPLITVIAQYEEIKRALATIYQQGRQLDTNDQKILSRINASFAGLKQLLTDEAKEGPRFFHLALVSRSNFHPRQWVSAKFRLTLWCEHSEKPLTDPDLDGPQSKGVYELELTREWFKKVAPFLKVMTSILRLNLPVVAAGLKLGIDAATYQTIEDELDFGQEIIDSSLEGGEKVGEWLGKDPATDLPRGGEIRAHGAMLREFHALLNAKDPTHHFGGLIRVTNKRNEFLWVHPQFEGEY